MFSRELTPSRTPGTPGSTPASAPSPAAIGNKTAKLSRLRGDTIYNVLDVVDDLCELRHLIEDLGSEAFCADQTDSDQIDDWSHDQFRRSIQLLKDRHQRHLDLIEKATRWSNPSQLAELLDSARRDFLSIKSALRAAYRQRGVLLCANDWQSPVYASTIAIGENRLTTGIAEHRWDYKRDGHLDALEYEKQFLDQYVSHLGSKNAVGYLANCGMAAFTTMLSFIAHELRLGESTVLFQPMYFENLHLARAFFPHALQSRPHTNEETISILREQQPSVVFCDAVTNCGDVVSFDIAAILKWAATETTNPTAIVIDTTCVPTVLLPAGLLKALPDHVYVVLVESLAKHHQFGMDTVTGGISILHAPDSIHENFRKARARFGGNIADASVGALPKPNREALVRRMKRHSQNTRFLAERLQQYIDSPDHYSVLESIAWLSEGTHTAQWYRGSCLNLRLHRQFKSVKHYQEFEAKVVEISKNCGHPIALSTSFGFDVSRLYVTAPSTPFEEPFLRVSLGTETTSEMTVFAEVLEQASAEMAKQWNAKAPGTRENRDAQPKEARPNVVAPIGRNHNVEKPGLRSSVFMGETALMEYLCPQNYAPTPLVELPGDLNPFKMDGVRIFAKMMSLVPLMNIKSIPAFSMLSKAADRGDLAKVERIIESSSSNTVLSLSIIARLFGIDNTCAIVDHSIPPGLLRMLRLFGIEPYLHPAPGHELFGVLAPRSQRASDMGAQAGWMNPGQYTNPDNPEGFAKWLAPDLWAQTQGRLAVLSCGLGTCGTMVGISRGLRERNPQIQVVANCPAPGHAIPGPRERSLLSDVTFDWHDVANARVELTAEEGFAASVKLLRRGIMGGPSSGMNYAGALKYLAQAKAQGRLDALRNQGEVWLAFLCCDSPLPHVEDYYNTLGEEYFPRIHPVPAPEADRTPID